ncbi:MAG: MmcQ/YjbR family DNA-binding protein [Deferribacteraceae bacterium]|jgi:predicted DNA-binding protein (MmcQ/YjbR family)|nr:MmcQ/YjbR family DNA-binding protein [Deferribacteraceae bacterium]
MDLIPYPTEAMKRFSWLEECLQEQLGVEREFKPEWQAFKYLIRDKMFAYIGVHEPTGRLIITLKLNPLDSYSLREQYVDIIPGYYMNKTNWSTIFLDGEVPQELIKEIACASHKVLLSSFSKKVQQEILGA